MSCRESRRAQSCMEPLGLGLANLRTPLRALLCINEERVGVGSLSWTVNMPHATPYSSKLMLWLLLIGSLADFVMGTYCPYRPREASLCSVGEMAPTWIPSIGLGKSWTFMDLWSECIGWVHRQAWKRTDEKTHMRITTGACLNNAHRAFSFDFP